MINEKFLWVIKGKKTGKNYEKWLLFWPFFGSFLPIKPKVIKIISTLFFQILEVQGHIFKGSYTLLEVTAISIDILLRTLIVSHVTIPLKISNKCKNPNTEQAVPLIILHLSLFKYVTFNKINPVFRHCVVCCQISH